MKASVLSTTVKYILSMAYLLSMLFLKSEKRWLTHCDMQSMAMLF